MKKNTPSSESSPIGENTVLTLNIPKSVHTAAYSKNLQKIAALVTVPGFRKGKAPLTLVEEQVSKAKILDQVLEDILPDIYAKAVKDAGIAPLVHPHLEVKELPIDGDWVVEASTAVAPIVDLKDWRKTVAEAGKEFEKNKGKAASAASNAVPEPGVQPQVSGNQTSEDKEQQKLSFIFSKLIEAANPKIAPLLLEHETHRQIDEFARHLASHRMELDAYLQMTKKTVEMLQQEYAASSLATLQLEFVLNALTKELDPKVTPEEIQKLLGTDQGKLPADTKTRIEEEATHVIRRRKVLDTLKSLAE